MAARASKRTQPYRGGGSPGPARAAMTRGKPRYLANPMDAKRAIQKRRKRRRKIVRVRRVRRGGLSSAR